MASYNEDKGMQCIRGPFQNIGKITHYSKRLLIPYTRNIRKISH